MPGSSCPCPYALGTDISPLQAHSPSHPSSKSPKAWGWALAPGPLRFWLGIVLAAVAPLIRGRGLAGPSCVWHLYTWGLSRGSRGSGLEDRPGVGVMGVDDYIHWGTYWKLRALPGRAVAQGDPCGP